MALSLIVLPILVFAQETPRKSLVYFGFGAGDNVLPPKEFKLEEKLSGAFEEGLKTADKWRVQNFTRQHASIRRALADGTLRSALLLPPFTGRSGAQYKGVILGRIMRCDIGVAGEIDSFSWNPESKLFNLVATLEVYDIKEGKLLGVVASSVAEPGDTLELAGEVATRSLAAKMLPQVFALLDPSKKAEGARG